MPVLFGGHNQPPLVEIGLTDLPKSGVAMAPPAPPGTTGLLDIISPIGEPGAVRSWIIKLLDGYWYRV